MKRIPTILSAVAVAMALFGCASSSPSPAATEDTHAACALRPGIEVKLVSTTGEGDRVPAWSGDGAVLEPAAWLTSADVERVDVVRDPERSQHALSIVLHEDARARLERLTGANVGRHIAIVVGGRVAATPVVRDPIHGAAILVTGATGADVDEMRRAVCG
jgi:preprotein translocase subunit SecD